MNVHRSYRAFSLIEMVMVVAIMGCVAGIAAPRLTSAASSANTSAAIANVRILENAVEVYAAEHSGFSPAVDSKGNPVDADLLVKRLTGFTDEAGNPGTGFYGPYLHMLPRNPGNYLRSLRVDGADAGAGTAGWRFDTSTGRFLPDDPAHATVLKGLVGASKMEAGVEEEP
ncbi:MAG: prepilin-type N-terminal cleavage/methylation domain-containing protein [Phycisphaerales bacterium]|nr:prepilin-type N-terminal cleavage/methylation domain-containing protein [Phycisphaerales bacterium]